MSQRLNKQLGIVTVKRKSVRDIDNENQPPRPKHMRRKIYVVDDDDLAPSNTIGLVLMKWHAVFNEIGVRRTVYSFLGLGDAIRFCLRNVMMTRILSRLHENRQWFVTFGPNAHNVIPTKDLTGTDIEVICTNHAEFADAYFTDCIRQIVRFGSVLCIPWVTKIRDSYFEDLHDDFKDANISEIAIFGTKIFNESILFMIRHNNLAAFQWFLELDSVKFDRKWLEMAIQEDRVQFVDHIMFKFNNLRRSARYAPLARSMEMMKLLWKYNFPFTAKVTNKWIAEHDMDKLTWLLANGVKQDLEFKQTDKELSYLEQAIKTDNYAATEKLAEFGFPCSTQVLAQTMLQGKLSMVECLYKCFFRDRRIVFENVEEHYVFLANFLKRLFPTIPDTATIVDIAATSFINMNLLSTLQFIEREHCNDLSFSLLYSTAIRLQSIDLLQCLWKCTTRRVNDNHMDEAIVLDSDAVCDWFLEKNIPCSQLGLARLMESDKAWKFKRMERLLNHPACAHLQLQPIWPTIQQQLRSTTEFHLVPMHLSHEESQDCDMECL